VTDRLLSAALERISPPRQEPLEEEQESPQTGEEEPERAEKPHPDTLRPQEGVQRPWWRRWFGS
jgi:hypothetical protein